MSEQLQERVDEVLHEADASSGSIVAGPDSDGSSELLETATQARELLDEAEPRDLLEAVGLDTLPDGSEPSSIPEAIATGDPEQVEDLRRLLRLSRLAEQADDGALEDAVDDLRATIDERTADTQQTEANESDGGEGETQDSAAKAESEDDEGDIGDRLRSAMSSSFESFGDDIQQLRDRLEEASAGDVSGESGESGADEADADETTDGEDEADEEGEGLLGSGLGSQDRGTSSGGASRHSTIAPSPSKRADMRSPVRFSTMPDKHRD